MCIYASQLPHTLLGATEKKGGSKPTVYHLPKCSLYETMPSCLGQWYATCL